MLGLIVDFIVDLVSEVLTQLTGGMIDRRIAGEGAAGRRQSHGKAFAILSCVVLGILIGGVSGLLIDGPLVASPILFLLLLFFGPVLSGTVLHAIGAVYDRHEIAVLNFSGGAALALSALLTGWAMGVL